MKKSTIVVVLVGLFSGNIYAQKTEVPGKIDYILKVETYRKMRNGGTVLTIVGSVLAIAGGVVMYNLKEDGTYPYETSLTNGSLQIIGGFMCVGAGIPLWIVGEVNHKKYSTKLKELSIKIDASPQAQGLTLAYRF